eukprot:UN07871
MSDRMTGLMTIATFAIARNIPLFIDWPEGRGLFDSTMDIFINSTYYWYHEHANNHS